MEKYDFIIDTDTSASLIDLELLSYVTGEYDTYMYRERGFSFLKYYAQEEQISYRGKLEYQCTQRSAFRKSLCDIIETPGFFDDGFGKIYTEEMIERENVQDKNPLLPVERAAVFFPALLSVAIHFADRPTQECIEVIKRRSLKFPEVYRSEYPNSKPFNILGFRLITEYTTITTTEEKI